MKPATSSVNTEIAQANLTPEQIHELVMRAAKNKRAFEAWQQQKERELQEKKIEKEKVYAKEQAERERRETKARALKLKADKEFEAWLTKKESALLRQKEQAKKKKEIDKQQEAIREKERQEAFEAWKRRVASRPASQPVIPHRQGWIELIPTAKMGLLPPEKTKKKGEPLLSPPHLYNDHAFYEAHAPEYLRKYGVLVASAGIGLYPEHSGVNKK